MKAEYKRDLKNNYLILELDQTKKNSGYGLQMAEKNEIPGLLNCHSFKKDGVLYLNYEITSRQSLKDLYERKTMGYQDILKILTDIRDAMEHMQKYLLDPAYLIFDPEYIFVGTDRKAVFCYYPGETETESMAVLAEFILKKLNHEDVQAVSLGYQFYQKICETNFSFIQTWKELIFPADQLREKEVLREDASAAETTDYIPRKDTGNSNFTGETMKIPEEYEAFRELYDSEEYKVIHKQRHKKHKKTKLDWLWERIHPLVLISGLCVMVLIEILYCLQLIQLAEAGGMFFLMASVEMLVNRFWKNRQEKHKKRPSYESRDYEEEQEYKDLKKELYQMEEEELGETCCLTAYTEKRGIRLICEGENQVKSYPDINLGNEVLYVGKRKGESDVILDSPTVSRMHARLEGRDGKYYVKDMNSRNGTYCNEQRLHPQEEREIQNGDQISFAQITYRVVKQSY